MKVIVLIDNRPKDAFRALTRYNLWASKGKVIMLQQQWALVDIETTGASATRDSITEVAIRLLDNWEVVETWQSLVQPTQAIPASIEALTGISNSMVAVAPTFAELAPIIQAKLADRLFVAHNARFDYAFLKNALQRAGFNWSTKVLCTVKLSRSLYPQHKRHNMDSLIDRHGLKAMGRHRALADVELMHQFLRHCRSQFGAERLEQQTQAISKRSSLPAYLATAVEDIPNTPGVYLFYSDTNALPIYIGKSINLRTRVLSHFSADHSNGKEFKMCQQVRHIEWRETAGELGALLLESKLVKEMMPIYNRKLRRSQQVACFRLGTSATGYQTLQITRASELEAQQQDALLGCFKSQRAAEATLRQLITSHKLCPKLCGLDKSSQGCFHYQLKKCQGACLQQENCTTYNLRVDLAIQKYRLETWPYAGLIGIQEFCAANELSALHVFDNWCHLGTVRDRDELLNLDYSSGPSQMTFDEVKILRSQLKKIPASQIIALQEHNL